MFLAPSHIYFTDCSGLLAMHDITPEKSFLEISRKITQNGDCPKLQVVERGGNFFTLNNTQLHVFRRLETLGKCPKVRVDRISSSDIPDGILRMMVIPNNNNAVTVKKAEDTSRKTTKGYHRLGQKEAENGETSESENESDETDTDDSKESESEFDWSDDDKEARGSENEGPSDEEKESLL